MLVEAIGGSLFCEFVGEFVVFAVVFCVGVMVDALIAVCFYVGRCVGCIVLVEQYSVGWCVRSCILRFVEHF